MKLINKDAFAAKIKKRFDEYSNSILKHYDACKEAKAQELGKILTILNTFEVKDPYEQCVQYDSIKAGIQAHAETYSFNIESLLFNQLTKEQQVLWRKEIEQACISGGEVGVELARDFRYKENVEVKEVDLEKEIDKWWWGKTWQTYGMMLNPQNIMDFAKHFFELGLKVAQKGE